MTEQTTERKAKYFISAPDWHIPEGIKAGEIINIAGQDYWIWLKHDSGRYSVIARGIERPAIRDLKDVVEAAQKEERRMARGEWALPEDLAVGEYLQVSGDTYKVIARDANGAFIVAANRDYDNDPRYLDEVIQEAKAKTEGRWTQRKFWNLCKNIGFTLVMIAISLVIYRFMNSWLLAALFIGILVFDFGQRIVNRIKSK